MWTILKFLIEFVTILLSVFFFFFFGWEAWWILAPLPGIEPLLPELESKVLTTGLPGKNFLLFFPPKTNNS